MATTTTTHYVDDIDGSTEDVTTITFALQGSHYEIDLSAANHEALTQALAPYVGHARKVPSSTDTSARTGRLKRASSTAATKTADGPATKEVRAWAEEHGHTVSARGRVPAVVFSADTDAH